MSRPISHLDVARMLVRVLKNQQLVMLALQELLNPGNAGAARAFASDLLLRIDLLDEEIQELQVRVVQQEGD